MDLIAHPFRVAVNGSLAKVEDGTDEANGQQIAVLVMTQPGERPLVPMFGVADPAFGMFDEAALKAQIDMFGPDVSIEDVQTAFVNDTSEDVTIVFSTVGDSVS